MRIYDTSQLLNSVRQKAIITPAGPLLTTLVHISLSSWTVFRSFEIIHRNGNCPLDCVLLRRKQSKSKPGTCSTRQPRHQLTPQIWCVKQRLIASPPQARNAALIVKRARRIPLQIVLLIQWSISVVGKLVKWKSFLQKTKNTSELQNQCVVSIQIQFRKTWKFYRKCFT